MTASMKELRQAPSNCHGQLPDFDKPPVIEVVCGVQFDEVESYHATTFGSFWQVVKDEYPKVEDKPPLPAMFEGPGLTPAGIRAEITEGPIFPRVFLVHTSPNWLIQLQRDRFLHNWRKINEDDAYPRYPVVFEHFKSAWARFERFWAEAQMGVLRINQLEITYINHIVLGDGWRDLGEIGHVLRDLEWKDGPRFLPTPESLALRMTFLLPDESGRLHVSVKQGIRQRDGTTILLCELTARGMVHAPEMSSMTAWFERGRQWIVQGFTDLTAAHMHRHWGLKT